MDSFCSPSVTSAERDAIAQRLAGALAIPTVSRITPTREDDECFLKFRRYLEKTFPLTHGALIREIVGPDYALLYTWHGSDDSLEPWLLSSHQDVVSGDVGSESHWTYPAFAGRIADGQIWGRGALDLKITLLASLEATEHLLRQGFRPRRTVYFAFGADEEIGGKRGAHEIAARLRADGVRLAFTLDEGGMVLSGSIPGVERPVALIGVAEKGEVVLRLVAEGVAAHSSMPGSVSAVGRLARAIANIEDHPMPAGLSSPIADAFAWLAPHARHPYRGIYRNLRLFGRVLLRRLRRDAIGDALVRTTLATTVVQAGASENVTPGIATAVVHARVKTGDRVAEVVSHVRKLVGPFEVSVEVVEAREASRISDTDTPEFRVFCETVQELMPGTVVAPFLSLNATDSRHYEDLARNQYRFTPIHIGADDLRGIHGTDEHVSVENYCGAVRFLTEFIRKADCAGSAPTASPVVGRPEREVRSR